MEQTSRYGRYKVLLSVLVMAVFIWAVIGALDITNIPYSGYSLSPDSSRVTMVREGSPAEQAGIKVGDSVARIDGMAIADTAGLVDRGRPEINSAGSLTIQRDGLEQTLLFQYASQPLVDIVTRFGFLTLTGLAFLILGLLAYLRNPTRLSINFCLLSLLFAISLFHEPYFAHSPQRRIIQAILVILFAILLGAILNYCLQFPKTKRVMASHPWLRHLIYYVTGSWGIMWATIWLSTPTLTPRRLLLLGIADGLVIAGTVLLAVVSIVHSYIKATAQDRTAAGLNPILLGLVIGFGPVLIAILLHTISPHMAALPGERFYTMTLIAIPVGMAMGLMRLEPAPAALKAGEPTAT